METDLFKSIRVGLFCIFGAVLLWIVHETFSESNFYIQKGYRVTAPFHDLKQLKKGSDVRLSGVSIGAVVETRLEEGRAVAVLSILPDFLIPADSVATITTAGLLGNNYIAIERGRSEVYLESGQQIYTRASSDINQLITDLGNVGKDIGDAFKGFKSGDGGGLFKEIDSLVAEIKPKINTVLDNMVDITDKLKKEEGTLGKIIANPELYNEVKSTVGEIRVAATDASKLFKKAQDVVDRFDSKDGLMGVLLYDEESAKQLKQSVANVHEFTEKLNNNNSTLGRLISDDELYRQASSALKKVDNAVESVENSGPVTAVGIAAGALF